MKIRFYLLLPLLCATLANATIVWDGNSSAWTAGSGTEADPYLIETPQHLAWLSDMLTAKKSNYAGVWFRQTDDFDMNASKYTWVRIGSESYTFQGNYDGDSHTITNITGGLFGTLSGATVKNVTITNAIGTSWITKGNSVDYAGALAKRALSSTISQCFNKSSITCSYYINMSTYVGGLIGAVEDCTLTRCGSEGDIVQSSSDNTGRYSFPTIGGLIGRFSSSTLTECYSKGNLKAKTVYCSIGGLVGALYADTKSSIVRCYSVGSVAGSRNDYGTIGGFFADIINPNSGRFSSMQNCYCVTSLGVMCGYGLCPMCNFLVTNSYFCNLGIPNDCGINASEGTERTESQIKAASFPIMLDENYFVADTYGVNNGYPIFTWQIPHYATITTVSDTKVGTVTGAGEYQIGEFTTLTATPNTGYHFVRWSDGNTDNPRTIKVTGDTTLTAEFAINQYNVALSANNANYGSVLGDGTYDYNTQVALTATPATGYHFLRWNDGNTDNPRTIFVISDTALIAEFAINQYKVTLSANNANYGSVLGDGTYDYNTQVALTATPATGYHFVRWSDGNTDNPRTIFVTSDTTLTAEFEKNVVLPSSGSAEVLSTSGRTSCEYVQLWENGPKWATFNVGATITDYADLQVGADATSFSNYADQAPYYNTANVGGLYPWNQPNYNGRQTTWTESVTTGVADVATTLWGSNWKTPTKEHLDTLRDGDFGKTTWTWCNGSTTQYVAGCTLKGYKVSGVGAYADRSIFVPAAGCFLCNAGTIQYAGHNGWWWSESEVNSNNAYFMSFSLTGSSMNYDSHHCGWSVRAIYVGDIVLPQTYTVTVQPNNPAYGSVTGGGTYEMGTRVTLTAIPASDCKFVRWSDGNKDNPRTITVTSDTTLMAVFGMFDNGHEYVDLGLPSGTMWASTNVQGFYSWGEVETKTSYDLDSYKWYRSTGYMATGTAYSPYKYTSTDQYERLQPEDDAATVIWGENWRTPTQAEWQELVDSCTWTWDGSGYTVKSKKNGNSISIWTAGVMSNTGYVGGGTWGYYWSSDFSKSSPINAYCLEISNSKYGVVKKGRDFGYSVRPVHKRYFTVTLSAISGGSVVGAGSYMENTQVTITATPESGYHFVRWSDGNTDNPRTITVTEDLTLMAVFEKVQNPSAEVLSTSGRTSCEYVQLWEGGPKWATFNVGATITDYADLTKGEDSTPFRDNIDQAQYYNTANVGGLYAWQQPNYNARKTTWSGTVSTGAADVATALWGKNWKTPTQEQIDTLLSAKTTRVWCDGKTTQFVPGCTLVGYKISGVGAYADKSIFMPAAGSYSYSSGNVGSAGDWGEYWTNTAENGSEFAFLWGFNTEYSELAHLNREYALSVRAVLAETPQIVQYSIVLSVNDDTMGTVNGAGTYNAGARVAISATPTSGYKFVRWSDGNTENPRTIIVTEDISLTAEFAKIEYEYVDLGLPSGTLWATKNLTPENVTGPTDSFYAWGATSSSGSGTWENYRFGKSESSLTKYCVDAQYGANGFTDSKTQLEAADDAATKLWGEEWRIPTYEDWQELLACCTPVSEGYARELRSKSNGATIRFHLSGYHVNGHLEQYERQGAYWTADLYAPRCYDATAILFDGDNIMPFHALRCWGLSIRPVRKPAGKSPQAMSEDVETILSEPVVVTKRIIDGTLYIIRDGHRYTTQGLLVE